MSVPDAVVAVIREWLAKADNDLKNAAHTLKLGQDAPTDTICFHAQQCIEKHLKALLVWRSTVFPKPHDVRALMELLPARLRPRLEGQVQDRMTAYATVKRYPGSGPDLSLTEARKAVALARRVRKEVRGRLPTAALRRKRK
jgi:HEPN domain-containing protein